MAGIEARKEIMAAYHKQKSKHERAGHKERIWSPGWLDCFGNHDAKEDDLVAEDPKLEGVMGSRILQAEVEKLGWTVMPYAAQIYGREYAYIEGTYIGHFLPSGSMGKAVAGSNTLNTSHDSFVCSHTHKYYHDQQQRLSGSWINHVNVGTFQPHNRLKPSEWNGAVILSEMEDGHFQIHKFEYDWIMRTYGEGSYAQELKTDLANRKSEREYAERMYG